MKRNLSIVMILALALLLAACGGTSLRPGGGTEQPSPGTYGDVMVTATREDATASIFSPLLNWLFPKAHAVEESTTKVRVVLWDQSTGIKVMKDVDMVAGMATASLRTPARLGYRVVTVEWEEDTGKIVSWGIEPSVDILTNKAVVLNVGMKTFSTARPTATTWIDRAAGGEEVMGSVTIPYDLKIGGFALFQTEKSEDNPVCYWATQMVRFQSIDSVPPARVDWSIPVPLLQSDESVTCEFTALVEVLDTRPQGFGTENMPSLSIVPDEKIIVTFDPPEVVIQ